MCFQQNKRLYKIEYLRKIIEIYFGLIAFSLLEFLTVIFLKLFVQF